MEAGCVHPFSQHNEIKLAYVKTTFFSSVVKVHSLTQVCAITHVVGQGSVFNNTNTHRMSGTLVKWNKSQKLVATLLDRLRLKLAVFVYRCWASPGRGPKPQPSDTQVESVMKHWSLRADRVTIDGRITHSFVPAFLYVVFVCSNAYVVCLHLAVQFFFCF